ncbi:dihydroorotate dehydrogenase electron transfer subunit [Clostridium sp. MSJ-11]|uniref:Dihydroorotate dehydrogenase electron transfer subunit n=1 Tax=Clostridium mobile TaxID=2841512 RepID=A0ABS6EGY6_9CLOT|nr:dihydroorotate dehydrogenase electron transfer subunit [Clostridium mobile]MBU5483669.1 dihydroorotate dehydrogenase electron transfer subunit [Clostridium mobile]
MKTNKGIVISNHCVNNKYHHLIIKCKSLAEEVKEGQIVHIRCGVNEDPFLRRPFSVYRFDKENEELEIVYIVKGKGTEIMTHFKSGDKIDILGPTGNGYKLNDKAKSIVVIGRGVGSASIISIAEKAVKQNMKVIAILSGKDKTSILGDNFLNSLGCIVYSLNDEDGNSSLDNVRDILEKHIKEEKIDQIFTCGSNRIGKFVKDINNNYKIPSFISLEEKMACGIGVCLACVCKTVNGYKTVCKHGPVFPIEEVCFND